MSNLFNYFLLLVIYIPSLCRAGVMRDIEDVTFDKVVEGFSPIIKKTTGQFYKETKTPNGNRFCVVEDFESFPRVIQVPDKKNKLREVQVRYKGQEYMCRTCNAPHVGACPVLKEYYETKDEKKNLVEFSQQLLLL